MTSIQVSVKQQKELYENYKHLKAHVGVTLTVKNPEFNRPGIDFVFVIDKSGSMEGDKLNLCKQTMEFIIKYLTKDDSVAIVTFDTCVTSTEMRKMDQAGKSYLQSFVSRIVSGSSTNLSGGLIEALSILRSLEEKNKSQVIFVLTDGLANVGITDTEKLVKVVEKEKYPELSVYTFGYGEDHNSDMLKTISTVGGGLYSYVPDTEDICTAFGGSLGNVMSMFLQNTKISFKALNNLSVSCPESYKATNGTDTCQVTIGDIGLEDEKTILFELTTDDTYKDCSFKCGIVKVEAYNIITEEFETFETDVYITFGEIPSVDNVHVVRHIYRIKMANCFKVTNRIEKNKARELLAHLVSELKKCEKDQVIDEYIKDVEEAIETLDMDMDVFRAYTTSRGMSHEIQSANTAGKRGSIYTKRIQRDVSDSCSQYVTQYDL
jgi:uncharacterized protein YegL